MKPKDTRFHWSTPMVPSATDRIVAPCLVLDQGLWISRAKQSIPKAVKGTYLFIKRSASTGLSYLLSGPQRALVCPTDGLSSILLCQPFREGPEVLDDGCGVHGSLAIERLQDVLPRLRRAFLQHLPVARQKHGQCFLSMCLWPEYSMMAWHSPPNRQTTQTLLSAVSPWGKTST